MDKLDKKIAPFLFKRVEKRSKITKKSKSAGSASYSCSVFSYTMPSAQFIKAQLSIRSINELMPTHHELAVAMISRFAP